LNQVTKYKLVNFFLVNQEEDGG